MTPWIVAPWAPLSMEFSRQEYWNGFPFPSPGDLPDPVIKLASLHWHVGKIESQKSVNSKEGRKGERKKQKSDETKQRRQLIMVLDALQILQSFYLNDLFP